MGARLPFCGQKSLGTVEVQTSMEGVAWSLVGGAEGVEARDQGGLSRQVSGAVVSLRSFS